MTKQESVKFIDHHVNLASKALLEKDHELAIREVISALVTIAVASGSDSSEKIREPIKSTPLPNEFTLADLKRQVDQAVQNETWCNLNQPFRFSESSDMLAVIGDFEIRRRK